MGQDQVRAFYSRAGLGLQHHSGFLGGAGVSLIKSFTKPDLKKTLNGGPLTIEFSDSVFTQDESIAKVAQPVRLFVLRGGHEMQLNTVNRDRLPDAQKHPENYRSLIVRVWGWSGIRQAA